MNISRIKALATASAFALFKIKNKLGIYGNNTSGDTNGIYCYNNVISINTYYYDYEFTN